MNEATERMTEVEKTAHEIIGASADLQMIMLYSPAIGRLSSADKEHVHTKLRNISNLAGKLMRRNGRPGSGIDEFDPAAALRVQAQNGMNCLCLMLKRAALRGGLEGENSELLKIRNMAEVVVCRLDQYLGYGSGCCAANQAAEVANDQPAA